MATGTKATEQDLKIAGDAEKYRFEYLFTPEEQAALKAAGVQRLLDANVKLVAGLRSQINFYSSLLHKDLK